MTKPTVSDAAVEAAFEVLGMSRLDIRAMLEAAYPHIAADVWAESRQQAFNDVEGDNWIVEVARRNPYRVGETS